MRLSGALILLLVAILGPGGCYGLIDPTPPPIPVIAPPPAGQRATPIRFGQLKIRLRHGAEIGDYPPSLFCGPSWGRVTLPSVQGAFSRDNLNDIFHRVFGYAGFDVAENPDTLFDEEEDILRGALVLSGALVDLRMIFCDRRWFFSNFYGGISGEVDLRVDWTLYSKLHRRILFQQTTTGRAATGEGRFEGDLVLVENAFAAALEALAADTRFRDLVFDTGRFLGPDLIGPGPAALPGMPDPFAGDPMVHEALVIRGSAARWSMQRDAERVVRAVVQVGGPGHGSGFYIGVGPGPTGWILTCNHVVGAAAEVRITHTQGSARSGQVVRRDPRRDVALIRVDGTPPAVLALRDEPLALGEDVYAVGTPLSESRRRSLTKGIVGGFRIDREVNLPMIQADAAVHGGMSGGPLLDVNGNVVGITYQTDRGEDGATRAAGLSFFVPIQDAVERLNLEMATGGRAED